MSETCPDSTDIGHVAFDANKMREAYYTPDYAAAIDGHEQPAPMDLAIGRMGSLLNELLRWAALSQDAATAGLRAFAAVGVLYPTAFEIHPKPAGLRRHEGEIARFEGDLRDSLQDWKRRNGK